MQLLLFLSPSNFALLLAFCVPEWTPLALCHLRLDPPDACIRTTGAVPEGFATHWLTLHLGTVPPGDAPG